MDAGGLHFPKEGTGGVGHGRCVLCGWRVGGRWEVEEEEEEEEDLIQSLRAVYAFGSFLRLKKPDVARPRHLQLHRSCMLSFSHSTIPGNLCFP